MRVILAVVIDAWSGGALSLRDARFFNPDAFQYK